MNEMANIKMRTLSRRLVNESKALVYMVRRSRIGEKVIVIILTRKQTNEVKAHPEIYGIPENFV